MTFETDQRAFGFRVKEIRESEELHGRTVLMEHENTGARLFWVDNGAENMVFSVTFRTLPEDSTGVFHILEHSVLCGSRKYPVKEPFVELLKSSMNTFLNAMTFQDMTMYPVSSRNFRDLMNLTGVYLDAVFDPLVLEDRKRFCQEGWHIDRDEEGNPVYRGVVYNEMKGAMSDTDTLIDRQIMRQLFPDTCYGFNSGGDPEEIPALTYERFREQYRRYYHPSNAFFYLDGGIDMQEMLPLIASYLDRYDRREEEQVNLLQRPVGSEKTIRYELGREEDPEDRGFLTMARITGTWRDRADNMARGIICDVLTGSNEAPLKRAVLERGLAQDISVSVDETVYQSWVTIHADNVTDGQEQAIEDLLLEIGETIRKEGLDPDAVEASMNRAIYALREDEEPQGIGRCIRCLGTWLYGADPTDALESAPLVREVKEYLKNGRFNDLAADLLLNRDNMAVLHTLPSQTLGEEKRRAEEATVRGIVASWTETEKRENDRLIGEIESWQSSGDAPEALRTLPRLTRAEADTKPEWTETEVGDCHGVPVLMHELNCNGVFHLRVYFSLTDYTLEELPKIAQLAGMMGHLPTEKYDALKLQQEIRRVTGSLGVGICIRSRLGQDETCTPYLTAYVNALEENRTQACELLTEILCTTRFEDKDRMIEMFRQNELSARQRVLSAGNVIAIKNVMSHYSADGAVKNALDGDMAVRYIHALAREPEKELPPLLEMVGRLMGKTLCRSRLTVSMTATRPEVPERLILAFPEGTPVPASAVYRYDAPLSVGYRIPAQIGFVARGWRLSRIGKTFEGSMWLAASILTLAYLWNRIRVQGGAYGAGIQADRSGNLASYSYRDPTPARTLTADSGAAEFLRNFAANGEDLDPYIISALNDLNPLIGARDRGVLADSLYMSGYTFEMKETLRRQILNTTPDDLLRCAEWLEAFSREGAVCVVAHQDALAACEGLEISDL